MRRKTPKAVKPIGRKYFPQLITFSPQSIKYLPFGKTCSVQSKRRFNPHVSIIAATSFGAVAERSGDTALSSFVIVVRRKAVSPVSRGGFESIDQLELAAYTAAVTVTLPKELEDFVLRKTATGEYPDANAVVIEALREFQSRSGDEAILREDGSCPPDLKSLLLEAVNGPHHPMPVDYFEKLRSRVRSSGAK